MEGFAERYHFGTSVVERSQFQSVLIRLGSAVYQEQAVILVNGHVVYLPLNDVEAMKQELSRGDICAVIIEGIQGLLITEFE